MIGSPKVNKKTKIKNLAPGDVVYTNFVISVCDTGVGISPEHIPKLFLDFGKLDDPEHRNTVGTGLGLSICKKIIELIGGSVSVTSEVNKGS